MKSGNIADALKEINKLNNNDKKLLSSWIDEATKYVDANESAEAVLKYVTRPNANFIEPASGL